LQGEVFCAEKGSFSFAFETVDIERIRPTNIQGVGSLAAFTGRSLAGLRFRG
jgi:hypothetical protein